MTRLCFIDTETTSLRPDRRAWDIGLIVRDGSETSAHQWFVDSEDLDLGNADPFALQIGRFYERHPDINPDAGPRCHDERRVLREVEALTRGAHLVGAVVSFDADVLGQRMRANGILPNWHYHLIDVEALAVGYIAGQAQTGEPRAQVAADLELAAPPWKSDDLTAALGLDAVPEDERHTALGDARWAMRIYDRAMGTTQ